MAKILIQHPTSDRIYEFTCEDMLICTSHKGITLVAEHDYTTVRVNLNWAEVQHLLSKTMTRLQQLDAPAGTWTEK